MKRAARHGFAEAGSVNVALEADDELVELQIVANVPAADDAAVLRAEAYKVAEIVATSECVVPQAYPTWAPT